MAKYPRMCSTESSLHCPRFANEYGKSRSNSKRASENGPVASLVVTMNRACFTHSGISPRCSNLACGHKMSSISTPLPIFDEDDEQDSDEERSPVQCEIGSSFEGVLWECKVGGSSHFGTFVRGDAPSGKECPRGSMKRAITVRTTSEGSRGPTFLGGSLRMQLQADSFEGEFELLDRE